MTLGEQQHGISAGKEKEWCIIDNGGRLEGSTRTQFLYKITTSVIMS